LTTTEAQAAVNAVRGFWDAIKGYIPSDIVLTVSAVVDQYDNQSGPLLASTSAPVPPATVAGTETGVYSMASGAKVNLNTTNIINGRRVRGSIFIVPIGANALTSSGTILNTARTAINNAADAMRLALVNGGLNLMVWSRPTSPGPSTDGELSIVTGCETSEKVAILRGRRD
jgi:hypothetical protein